MSWDEDDYLEDEWVEDDSDDEDDGLICPSCRAEVHEDTQQCPQCGDWITPVYPGEETRRWIWTVAALLVILAFLLFIVF